jgi:YD repeat-containing protein
MKKLILSFFLIVFSNVLATTYQYDELNRLIRVEYSPTKAINYSYDSAGNLLTIKSEGMNCTQVITHAYNPMTGEEKDYPTPCDIPDGWITGQAPDNDNDGINDILDPDDDNDGVNDLQDAFPFDAAESIDTDSDGIGNNADTDDDNDGIPDTWEIQYGLDPLNASDAQLDNDNDGITNLEEYTQGTNPNGTTFTLDIDGDGEYKPLTDGMLIMRYQFGFRGETLINGAVAQNATRKTAAEIETYLINSGLSLDIDGDGELKPLTDGMLIMRYLFGFRGDTLINGAVAQNASRKTAGEIETRIRSLMQ